MVFLLNDDVQVGNRQDNGIVVGAGMHIGYGVELRTWVIESDGIIDG